MTDKKKIEELIDLIITLRNDAEMALNGKWDKSDDGFKDQIYFIDKKLEELGDISY